MRLATACLAAKVAQNEGRTMKNKKPMPLRDADEHRLPAKLARTQEQQIKVINDTIELFEYTEADSIEIEMTTGKYTGLIFTLQRTATPKEERDD